MKERIRERRKMKWERTNGIVGGEKERIRKKRKNEEEEEKRG